MFNKDNVQKILTTKGWTNYRLAKEANLGQSTVHEIMSGKKKTPNAETIQKIANALQVSVNELFQETDTPFAKEKLKHNISEQPERIETSKDIRRIERARNKMSEDDQEKMMKILEAAFDKYFKD